MSADLDLLIRAPRVITAAGEVARCIGVRDGRIVAIGSFGREQGGEGRSMPGGALPGPGRTAGRHGAAGTSLRNSSYGQRYKRRISRRIFPVSLRHPLIVSAIQLCRAPLHGVGAASIAGA